MFFEDVLNEMLTFGRSWRSLWDGFWCFCDASLLRLSRGQFFGPFARWSRAKSAVWALGGGCLGASADSFWEFWAATFASIAVEVSFEGSACPFFVVVKASLENLKRDFRIPLVIRCGSKALFCML